MINLKFTKKTKNSDGTDEYEEISEKKTSKLGYVLLIILVIFLIIIGQKVFSDIENISKKPVRPAYCIESYSDIDKLKNLNYSQSCRFSDLDRKFNIDKNFKIIEAEINEIIVLNTEIRNIEKQINSRKNSLDNLLKQYDISLQEIIAEEEGFLINKSGTKISIVSLNNEISSLSQKLNNKEIEKNNILNLIQPKLVVLKTSYDKALKYCENKKGHHNLIVFLLKLLFILPLFVLSLRFYFRLKRKNSPHTIIAAAILTALSILFSEIVLIFLYQILPMEWLMRIFKILMEIAVLRYIIYYGSALLVIVIFGGIVYYIQKKVYNPKIIAIRRLKDNKCPNCSFALDRSYVFCPKCGEQLKEKCSNCGNLKMKNLPYCPSCGKK